MHGGKKKKKGTITHRNNRLDYPLTRRETGRGKHVKREKIHWEKKLGNALKRDNGSAGADLVLFGHLGLLGKEKRQDGTFLGNLLGGGDTTGPRRTLDTHTSFLGLIST